MQSQAAVKGGQGVGHIGAGADRPAWALSCNAITCMSLGSTAATTAPVSLEVGRASASLAFSTGRAFFRFDALENERRWMRSGMGG